MPSQVRRDFLISVGQPWKSSLSWSWRLHLVYHVALDFNATALFNHSNAHLPMWPDLALRLVLVTPDMHRVHHSVVDHETNNNFGFCLSWWDVMFRTYVAQPDAGHHGMTIGRPQFRELDVERLPFLLVLPFHHGFLPAPCRDNHHG